MKKYPSSVRDGFPGKVFFELGWQNASFLTMREKTECIKTLEKVKHSASE